MKRFLWIFIQIVFGFLASQTQALLLKPLCVDIGTSSEGWALPGHEFQIKKAHCADKVVECKNIGTRSEGWYIFEKQNIRLMQYSNCENKTLIPQCVFIGTPYEGWVVPARGLRLYYHKCSEQGVECGAQGTRSEGWYIFNKTPRGLLQYANCAGLENE